MSKNQNNKKSNKRKYPRGQYQFILFFILAWVIVISTSLPVIIIGVILDVLEINISDFS